MKAPIIVHDPDHLNAVFESAATLRVSIIAITAAWAGAAYGALYWVEAVAAAREKWPEADVVVALHCLDDAGRAMAALRMGWKRLVFTGGRQVRDKIIEQAAVLDAAVIAEPEGPVLDLGEHADPAAAVTAWIAAESRCK